MVTIGMNYQVLVGKNQEFEDKFRAVLEAMETMTDHDESHLFKDVNDENSYLIVSNWSDEAAFAAFIKSDSFKEVTSHGMENLLADRPRHKVYKA